ncbi:hypothetical protein Tsubulata_014842 [Turnera subulata]|uniref:Uncharacterized protein n=1 Tax=Turnera subulata TaxID=218843 RepID=A0A9Q0FU78_9ROSI|nr:hypothetical protein Tsubulata_014842 [Turnera subulata]
MRSNPLSDEDIIKILAKLNIPASLDDLTRSPTQDFLHQLYPNLIVHLELPKPTLVEICGYSSVDIHSVVAPMDMALVLLGSPLLFTKKMIFEATAVGTKEVIVCILPYIIQRKNIRCFLSSVWDDLIRIGDERIRLETNILLLDKEVAHLGRESELPIVDAMVREMKQSIVGCSSCVLSAWFRTLKKKKRILEEEESVQKDVGKAIRLLKPEPYVNPDALFVSEEEFEEAMRLEMLENARRAVMPEMPAAHPFRKAVLAFELFTKVHGTLYRHHVQLKAVQEQVHSELYGHHVHMKAVQEQFKQYRDSVGLMLSRFDEVKRRVVEGILPDQN